MLAKKCLGWGLRGAFLSFGLTFSIRATNYKLQQIILISLLGMIFTSELIFELAFCQPCKKAWASGSCFCLNWFQRLQLPFIISLNKDLQSIPWGYLTYFGVLKTWLEHLQFSTLGYRYRLWPSCWVVLGCKDFLEPLLHNYLAKILSIHFEYKTYFSENNKIRSNLNQYILYLYRIILFKKAAIAPVLIFFISLSNFIACCFMNDTFTLSIRDSNPRIQGHLFGWTTQPNSQRPFKFLHYYGCSNLFVWHLVAAPKFDYGNFAKERGS